LAGLRLIGLWGILPAFGAVKTYVRREEDLEKGVLTGLLAAGATLTATVVATLLFFPYPSGTRLTHPLGILARSIYLGRYFQRLEAVFVFTWFFPSAIQAGFTYFVILVFLAQMSGVNTYRMFLPALSALTFAIGAMPVSLHKTAQVLTTYFFDTAGIALISLGWVLYGVARLRGIKPPQAKNPEKDPAQDTEQDTDPDTEGVGMQASESPGRGPKAQDKEAGLGSAQKDRGGDYRAPSGNTNATSN
jgi:hypothetical protein